jgi:hypothetical protein
MNEPQHSDRGRPTKPLDFSTFLISLGTSAMIQLGDAPDPTSGGMLKADPEGARQTIDLLGLLKEKTTGNLDPAESELLTNLLTDLRLRAVQLQTNS